MVLPDWFRLLIKRLRNLNKITATNANSNITGITVPIITAVELSSSFISVVECSAKNVKKWFQSITTFAVVCASFRSFWEDHYFAFYH